MNYLQGRDVIFQTNGELDFGNVNATQKIQVPEGHEMRIDGIYLQVNEAFVGTDAKIQFGDGTDADKYGEVVIDTDLVDATGGFWIEFGPESEYGVISESPQRHGGDYKGSMDLFFAGTEITITYVATTGAGKAGKANVTIYAKLM